MRMKKAGETGTAPTAGTMDDAGEACKPQGMPPEDGIRATAPRAPWAFAVWTGVLALYLAVTFPLLLAGVMRGSVAAWALLPHAAVTGWAFGLRTRGRPARAWAAIAADWTFLLLIPALYAELPLLMEGLHGVVNYHDPLLQGWERALAGGSPAFEWAGALPVVWVSEVLHLGYLLYYPIIYVPPLVLYLRREPGERAAFHGTVLATVLALLACYVCFVLFPVQGPRYLGVPAGVPDGPVRSLALAVLEGGSSRGAAFPSSHVAVAVALSVAALRWQRPVGAVVAAIAIPLALGAVYGGFHYLFDVVVGAVVGLAAGAVAVGVGGDVGGRVR